MKRTSFLLLTVLMITCQSCSEHGKMPDQSFNLKFPGLANVWDEAIPLGNGMLGALVWEKDGKLRLSLDRADLWDLRPMENIGRPEWKFSWIKEQWSKDNYKAAQDLFDDPYTLNPAPSKIPGGALEFDISALGEIQSAELSLRDAQCVIKWKSGVVFRTFINATGPVGWFRFEGPGQIPAPEFIQPAYNIPGDTVTDNSHSGQDLRLLGYPAGKVKKDNGSVTYDQEGWGGFSYQLSVRWKNAKNITEGCWSISAQLPGSKKTEKAEEHTLSAMSTGFLGHLRNSTKWWNHYWMQSSITIPDQVLQKQWYMEIYKLGAATGNGAPPISLQAVWTADNGKLPPWKGDFHNDLNTQLSYWPTYSSNHIEQESGYIKWLEDNKPEFEKYTKDFFEVPGLNVPGVCSINGHAMGGWIQYAFGPTVSAWLAHHFYLHWRYTLDRNFLEKDAYPWIREVATYLEAISIKDNQGMRRLPLSSSPEIYNNSREAWFSDMTNFDLGLTRWTFEKAAELAGELGISTDQHHWKSVLSEWPPLDIDSETGLTWAKGKPYNESHRHFSHLVAFHPLGVIDMSKGNDDQRIIRSTIATLDRLGPDWWCGYSYSWLGNLKARAFDGNGAADALRIFATDFCLKNSFHVNGDQSKSGKSKFVYRPFTLEGNFAFAAGIQEMLIQSHTGVIRIFPAIPDSWKIASFSTMRAEGAFIVSASMVNGEVTSVDIVSEKGGDLKIASPFKNQTFQCSALYKAENNILIIHTVPGQKVWMKNQ